MLKALQIYLVTLGAFFLIDMIWLGLVAKNFYRQQLGFLMASRINWAAAIIFYLLFIGGLLFFVVYPSLARDSWLYALLAGAFFGLIAYSTYDLSNLATIKDWPYAVVFVDIVWGTSLSAVLSVIGFLYGRSIY